MQAPFSLTATEHTCVLVSICKIHDIAGRIMVWHEWATLVLVFFVWSSPFQTLRHVLKEYVDSIFRIRLSGRYPIYFCKNTTFIPKYHVFNINNGITRYETNGIFLLAASQIHLHLARIVIPFSREKRLKTVFGPTDSSIRPCILRYSGSNTAVFGPKYNSIRPEYSSIQGRILQHVDQGGGGQQAIVRATGCGHRSRVPHPSLQTSCGEGAHADW